MFGLIEAVRKRLDRDVLTDQELATVVGGTADRWRGMLKRATARGDLVRVRRGLYCLAAHLRREPLDLHHLAQYVYGPSYISLETALSVHGWIPEGVFTVTSATSKRSRVFETSLGRFSFDVVPCHPFLIEVQRVENEGRAFLLASPWKALMDYVYVHGLDWRGSKPIVQSLRVDPDRLRPLPRRRLARLAAAYRSRPVRAFAEGLLEEVGP